MTIPLGLCGLIAGIFLAAATGIKYLYIVIIATAVILTAVSFVGKCFNFTAFFTGLMLITGIFISYKAHNFDSSVFSDFENCEVAVEGRICELPTEIGGNNRYIAEISYFEHEGKSHLTKEKLIVTSKEKFKYNDVIYAEGKLKRIPQNQNENSFNSALYYKSLNISFKMYSEKPEKRSVVLSGISIHSLSNTLRSKISESVSKYYSGDRAAIINAVITGNKKMFTKDFDNLITRTGAKRCMYPAYLHIMFFITLVSYLSGILKPKYRTCILCIVLLIFGAVNSANPIFIKSALYTALVYAFRQKMGYVHRPDMLALTVMAMLIFNPLLIYNGGFIISVGASILIFVFMDYVKDKLGFIKTRRIRRIVAVNIICIIGLLPISAYYFNGISLYQVFASLIFIPATIIILAVAPFVLILYNIFGGGFIVGKILEIPLAIYMKVPYFLDNLPYSYITLPTPGLAFICAFYLLLYAFYLYFDERRFYIPLSAGALLSVYIAITQIMSSYTAQITFINVGQGDGTLISVPYRCNIIIDGGGSADYTDYNIGEELFVPYLQTHGKTNIDAAFVSHYHKDHVEGIVAAIEMLRVKEIYMPDVLPENEWRIKIEETAHKNNTKINYLAEDTTIRFKEGIIIDAIAPTKMALFTEDENNTGMVYRVHYGNTSCLFTGDITASAERALINEGKFLKSEILKVAHHGSGKSTCPQFVEAVNPQYALISLGKDNPYDFPRKEVIENLKGIEILRTDQKGDIRFIVSRKGIEKIETLME